MPIKYSAFLLIASALALPAAAGKATVIGKDSQLSGEK